MASYISSNNNRFYVAAEPNFGAAAAIASQNRFPAVKLSAKQQPEKVQRKDKTGSRTFVGLPVGIRKQTSYELSTYMTDWTTTSQAPGYGPLFQAALGRAPQTYTGGNVASVTGNTQVEFSGAHGLSVGQAVTFEGEIRFVSAVANTTEVILNAPFSNTLGAGAAVGATVTYAPANALPSNTIFDYWDPSTAVHRVLVGAAVDKMDVKINGDFHEFTFGGPAADVLDSSSFTSGEGSLTQFPPEPALAPFDYTIIPGHLGQVWLGNVPNQFFTLTSASVSLSNSLDVRNHEFGSDLPRAVVPGERAVTMDLSLFQQDDAATPALYQAARQRSPISVMFQLGQLNGQLFGIYMSNLVPEVPQYDDSETRLQWKFQGSRAQGSLDNELFIAFG
ncbi:MAG: phage tail tube protein [Bryobacteraceae bacterium]